MLELTVDQTQLIKLAKIMKAESNSLQMKRDLIASFRAIAEPAINEVKGKLQGIQSHGIASNPPLGSYLASRVKLSTRLSGQRAGVYIKIGFTPSLRGFKLAARRLNHESWRRRVYGRNVWVTQMSPIPGFFDETLSKYKGEYTAAVLVACRRQARRLGERL